MVRGIINDLLSINYGSGTDRDTKKAWPLQMALSICFTCNEVSLPILNNF